MASDWPAVALGTVAREVSRPERIDSSRAYQLLGAHWYAKGLYVKEERLGSEIRATSLFAVNPGDFVYNRLFAWKGSFAVAQQEHEGCYVSNEFPCFELDRERVVPQFLWLYFSREQAWREALGLSSGSTPTSRNRLKQERFLGMKIPLPPLPEQRRIVARVEELAGQIEEARGLRERAREEADSFVTSLHSQLAQGRLVSLSEILVLDELRESVYPGRKYPQAGIRGFGQGLFAKEAVDADRTEYREFNRLYEGAIVLSQLKGWEGAISVCPALMAGRYVTPEYRTFRCIPGQAIPDYLAALFATPWFWTQLRNLSRGLGGRRQRTRPEQFLGLRVFMPKIEEQQVALSLLKKLAELRRWQEETTPEIAALLPAVLERAFRGEL